MVCFLFGANMATFEEHCEDCVRALGKPYREVHLWLDELFKVLGPKHRDVRHHTGGVEEVRKRWGDEAAKAAEIHIRKDCIGYLPSKEEAQTFNLFGPDIILPKGKTFLTDEYNGGEDEKNKTDKNDN